MKTKDIQAQAIAFLANRTKAADRADQKVLEARGRDKGAELLEWVEGALLTMNPWELFEKYTHRLTTGDMCGEAMVRVLEDTASTALRRNQVIPELRQMADKIADMALVSINQYKAVADFNRKARKADKKKLPVELRPAEIYRRFAQPLRWLRERGHVHAAFALQTIMRQQTRPFVELDNPDWIDPYTKKLDPDAPKPGELKVRITEPVLDTEIAKAMVEDLGWDEDTVRTFLTAQEGFNSEDGLEDIMAAVNEDALGRLDDRIPQWMQIQEDCHPTKEIGIVRAEAQPWTKACRKLIDELVKEANAQVDMADPYWKSKFFKFVREGFRTSAEAKDFLDFLSSKSEEGAAPADLGVLFLSLQHGYGFEENDAYEVKLRDVPNFNTLGDWLAFWGDELMEAMHDAPMRWREMPVSEIDAFVEETTAGILEANDHPTSDIFRTRAFMEGYLQCMMNSNIITKQEGDQRRNYAVEAGWESYRQWKNKEGAAAYHKAKAEGKTQKEAMAEFWKHVRAHDKRVATGTVVQPRSNGLLLNTGRVIDWKIAMLKLQNNELYFPGDTRERIKKALIERGVGLDFANAL